MPSAKLDVGGCYPTHDVSEGWNRRNSSDDIAYLRTLLRPGHDGGHVRRGDAITFKTK